jgi:hypothetical protein
MALARHDGAFLGGIDMFHGLVRAPSSVPVVGAGVGAGVPLGPCIVWFAGFPVSKKNLMAWRRKLSGATKAPDIPLFAIVLGVARR